MEIGEAIAVAAVAPSKADCWFCKEPAEVEKKKTDLKASPDTSAGEPADFVPENREDINDARNGVWLPGNYAVREGNPEFNNKTWSLHTPKFQRDYVKVAMDRASGKMFHDAHRTYNGKVKTTLLSIANKLSKPKKGKCPICAAEARKTRPPYGLVGRLHGVSRWIAASRDSGSYPQKAHDFLMFRLAENCMTVVVHESIKKAVDAAGIRTFSFINSEDWTQL
jgi:hypothetical protein